ncbi:MAG: chemotaxis protein CheW [Gemmatimonadota bacterium]|nr:MAG: chemotaxis protein CheW [Gemmatimonadota bacterium]
MTAGDEVQLVTFRVGGHDFAVNIFQVERILRYQNPAPLPKAPAFLEGVVRYGDAVVPLMDLRKRVDLEAPVREETRIMILELDGEKIGVVVDAVQEVLRVSAERISPPASIVRGLAAKYINGVVVDGDRTLVLLQVSKLLSSKERLALEKLEVEASHE